MNIVADVALSSPRVRWTEQVSANRWHNEVLLESGDQIDGEFLGWVEAAWRLAQR